MTVLYTVTVYDRKPSVMIDGKRQEYPDFAAAQSAYQAAKHNPKAKVINFDHGATHVEHRESV